MFLKIRYFAGHVNINAPFVVRENITNVLSGLRKAGEKHLVVL